MTAGKSMTRTAFKATLEMLCLIKYFKRNIDFQFPGYKLGRVDTLAAVMLRHTLFQV